MHFECRLAGSRSGTTVPWIWFYRWGFTVWIGRIIFGFGHDTRSRSSTRKA